MKNTQSHAAHRRILRHLSNLCLNACLALATLTGPTACQQDMPAADNALPDGKYPVLISAVAPQTRVVDEGETSKWEEGDRISVILTDNPKDVGIYELNQNGTVKQVIKPLYYRSAAPGQKLRAWYPATENTKDTIIDYTTNKVDDWLYGTCKVDDIFAPVNMELEHLNSKLRVTLKGDTEGIIEKVEVNALSKVKFIPSSDAYLVSTDEYINRMELQQKDGVWTGYVGRGSEISSVYVNGTAVLLDNPITTEAGKISDIIINANIDKADEAVDLSKLTDTYRITKPGKYYFTGGINMINFTPIVVEAPATLVLDNVNLHTYTAFQLYITAPDTTTIKLKGYNSFSESNGNDGRAGITLDGADTHLLIEGPGTLFMGSYIHAAIGTPYKKGEEVACGDITIKNATILLGNAGAGHKGSYIGTGACDARGRQKHGNITIVNSFISANPRNTTKSYGIGTVVDEGLRSPDNGEIHIYLRKRETEEDFLGRLNDKEYNVDPRAQFHPYEETPDWLK